MPLERTYANNRILVTGGAGFIGSHLCERLLARGAEVICVDNYFTGSRRNIAHLLSNPLFEAMCHDVTFPLYVEIDAIFNLACPASPIHYQRDPVQTTKTSVHGAISMLGSPNASASASFRPQPAKSMAIRWCTPSRKNIGATSTPSAHAVVTTKPSVLPKR